MAAWPSGSGSAGRARAAVIGGCGRTGVAIARALAESGCAVRIFDIDPSAFDHLAIDPERSAGISAILGDITLDSHLRAAETQNADMFVAVSGSDPVNIISAQIALHILEVPMVVCRLEDPVKRDLYDKLGLTAISPTDMLRDLVLERLQAPGGSTSLITCT